MNSIIPFNGKTPAIANSELPIADGTWQMGEGKVSEEVVIAACKAAAKSEAIFVHDGLIAGLLLLEYRASHPANFTGTDGANGEGFPRGKPSLINGRNQHSGQPGFVAWLESNDIPHTSAYRWMENAKRIALHCLGRGVNDDLPEAIDIEATTSLALALTAPEQGLPEAALNFRQAVFDFMGNKTLGEAARAAFGGDSAGSRITRAGAGKLHGGASDLDADPAARKQFPLFCARGLTQVVANVGARLPASAVSRRSKRGGHWPNLSERQKQEVREYFTIFVEGLDTELLEFHAETTRAELADRRKGKLPAPLRMGAAMRKALAAQHNARLKARS